MRKLKIAYFITPHGFGHAARSAAVMLALLKRDPNISLSIYTKTAEWFFQDSQIHYDKYSEILTDIGLVQESPMHHDLPQTISRVQAFLHELPDTSSQMAEQLKNEHTDLVLCDISPLGISAAKKAGIPCILFENFTWDWIYEVYQDQYPQFIQFNQTLNTIFSSADYRCQLTPECCTYAKRDQLFPPISRPARIDREEMRRLLSIPPAKKVGMISMGGIPQDFSRLMLQENRSSDITYIVPGNFDTLTFSESLILLPHHSSYYHPDLLHCADFVIGKTGYSTIAEVRSAGIPFAYLLRNDFRESPVLGNYLRGFSNTLEIDEEHLFSFRLSEISETLLKKGNIAPEPINGAELAAAFILSLS